MDKKIFSSKMFCGIVEYCSNVAIKVAEKYTNPDAYTKRMLGASNGRWDFLWISDFYTNVSNYLHWFYPFTEAEAHLVMLEMVKACHEACNATPDQCCGGFFVEGDPEVKFGSNAWTYRVYDYIWDALTKFVDVELIIEEGGDM